MDGRIIAATIASLALLTTTGCTAPTATGPGDGPAVVHEEAATTEPTYHEEPEAEPTSYHEEHEEPAEGAEEYPFAEWGEKITYPDGVEVEVIKLESRTITDGEVAEWEADYEDPAPWESGDAIWKASVRVKNQSPTPIDVMDGAIVTYGDDGIEAEATYEDTEDVYGMIPPGKAKTGIRACLMPKAHAGDEVLFEYSFDYEHQAAIFMGALTEY